MHTSNNIYPYLYSSGKYTHYWKFPIGRYCDLKDGHGLAEDRGLVVVGLDRNPQSVHDNDKKDEVLVGSIPCDRLPNA